MIAKSNLRYIKSKPDGSALYFVYADRVETILHPVRTIPEGKSITLPKTEDSFSLPDSSSFGVI